MHFLHRFFMLKIRKDEPLGEGVQKIHLSCLFGIGY